MNRQSEVKGATRMFFHTKQLQYPVRVDKPDPVYARQLQELIGGQFGEMAVMTQYLFQGWNLRGATDDERLRRIKDMLLDTATEEIGHVEMLATCVGMLLDGASPEQQEEAAKGDPVVYGVLSGMNPHHLIVSGLGARPVDSAGNPFNAGYTIGSGNVVADLYANVNAEMQGRLQAARLYEMTSDTGVRDMLSFLIARDRMHQNQWLAAIEELGGPTEVMPVPVTFPLEKEVQEVSYAFLDFSKDPDGASRRGRWAHGRSIDGKGRFTYVEQPTARGEAPALAAAPPTLHNALMGGPVGREKPARGKSERGKSVIDRVTDAIAGDEEQPQG
jgi:Mn-containing catalase